MTEMPAPKSSMAVRTRILLAAWLLSILPLLALYLVLGLVLKDTRSLVAHDAGEYGQRRGRSLSNALQEKMDSALRANLASLEALWQAAYSRHGETQPAVQSFLSGLPAPTDPVFVFDEERRLVGAVGPHPKTAVGAKLEDVERELQGRYTTSQVELRPVNYRLLATMPRERFADLTANEREFRADFTAEVSARFDIAVARLRQIALGMFIGLCLVTLVMWRWLTVNLTRPLRTLAAAMAGFDGQTPVALAAERADEIGGLTLRFKEMTDNLIEARAAVEAKQAALEKADQELMQLNLNLEKHITDRTADLQLAYARLRELDKNKDDFLSLVSHELKTPLTSIAASAEALLSKDLPLSDEARARFLKIVRSEAQRLTRLIDDLLDMTSLEAGRIHFHLRPTDLYKLVRQTAETYRLAIRQKALALDLNLSGDPRLRSVVLDADRVVQVVTNLLANAIKFTERGHITVTLDVADSRAGEPMARIAVTDTGIGIRSEDAHKVFDRFQQIEKIDTHHEGLGLGMPICRMIVESLGGEISFESEPGRGTVFTVLLPLRSRLTLRPKKSEQKLLTMLDDPAAGGAVGAG